MRMDDVMHRHTTENAIVKTADDFVAILQSRAYKTTQSATVLLVDDNVVADVDKTTCQVTGVGRLQSGIGKTLTSTVSRDKVLEHAHTFLKVRKNWVLDGVGLCTCLLRLSHKATHTRELANLTGTTTSTRVKHHVYGIEALVGLLHGLHQSL